MQTIPHLVRTCRFPFQKRVLFVDTALLGREYLTRPGIGTMEELYACCESLVQDGVIDEVIDIPYATQERKQGYRKHFAHPLFHGDSVPERTPGLIQQIETGQHPPEQEGFYDLKLDYWTAQDSDQPFGMNSYA